MSSSNTNTYTIYFYIIYRERMGIINTLAHALLAGDCIDEGFLQATIACSRREKVVRMRANRKLDNFFPINSIWISLNVQLRIEMTEKRNKKKKQVKRRTMEQKWDFFIFQWTNKYIFLIFFLRIMWEWYYKVGKLQVTWSVMNDADDDNNYSKMRNIYICNSNKLKCSAQWTTFVLFYNFLS